MPTLPPEELELLDDELLDELELDDELEEELDEELLDELDEEDELLDELLLEEGDGLVPPPHAQSAADTTVNMVQRAKRAEELIIYLPFVIGLAS